MKNALPLILIAGGAVVLVAMGKKKNGNGRPSEKPGEEPDQVPDEVSDEETEERITGRYRGYDWSARFVTTATESGWYVNAWKPSINQAVDHLVVKKDVELAAKMLIDQLIAAGN